MVKYLIPPVITQHHKYLTAASHLHETHIPFSVLVRVSLNPSNPPVTLEL